MARPTDYRSIDLDPGVYTVVITLPTGQKWTREIDLPTGRVKCIVLNYRPSPPPPKSPCFIQVNTSAPTQVNEGEIITYTADVADSGTAGLMLHVDRQSRKRHASSVARGTRTITVDSTSLAGRLITATLVVEDGSGDPSCRQTTKASTNVPPRETNNVGREFDTCALFL